MSIRWLLVPVWLLACSPSAPPPPEPVAAVPVPPEVVEEDVPEPEPEPVAAPAAIANRTESGITWTVMRDGTSAKSPGQNDTVRVHYQLWDRDGKLVDSSLKRGKVATFGVQKVIKGWTEVLQLMVVGDKWRVVIPSALAYGDNPTRPGAPAGDLTFEIELIDVIAAPAIPANVAAPPPNATVTASGLAYVVLSKGVGRTHPTTSDRVEVHYSGWMTDGKMFDSSVTRGRPAKFGVSGVIKGWTEGLQLMTPGDAYRFWIPADLAYGNTPKRPGAPFGTLVFDVELIAIIP